MTLKEKFENAVFYTAEEIVEGAGRLWFFIALVLAALIYAGISATFGVASTPAMFLLSLFAVGAIFVSASLCLLLTSPDEETDDGSFDDGSAKAAPDATETAMVPVVTLDAGLADNRSEKLREELRNCRNASVTTTVARFGATGGSIAAGANIEPEPRAEDGVLSDEQTEELIAWSDSRDRKDFIDRIERCHDRRSELNGLAPAVKVEEAIEVLRRGEEQAQRQEQEPAPVPVSPKKQSRRSKKQVPVVDDTMNIIGSVTASETGENNETAGRKRNARPAEVVISKTAAAAEMAAQAKRGARL